MEVFTIGFTGTSAREFFVRLLDSGVTKLIDVRLHNSSQLSGFAKKKDLEFFCETIGGINYQHCLELAPEEGMLARYRVDHDWEAYAKAFLKLMKKRKIENLFAPADFENACFLCSEKHPHKCHRKLVAEYFGTKWDKLNIIHL